MCVCVHIVTQASDVLSDRLVKYQWGLLESSMEGKGDGKLNKWNRGGSKIRFFLFQLV